MDPKDENHEKYDVGKVITEGSNLATISIPKTGEPTNIYHKLLKFMRLGEKSAFYLSPSEHTLNFCKYHYHNRCEEMIQLKECHCLKYLMIILQCLEVDDRKSYSLNDRDYFKVRYDRMVHMLTN